MKIWITLLFLSCFSPFQGQEELSIADSLMMNSKYKEAIQAFLLASTKNKNDYDLKLKLAKAYVLNNEFLNALKCIKFIRNNTTRNSKVYWETFLLEAEIHRKRDLYQKGIFLLHKIKFDESDSLRFLEILIQKHQRLSAIYNETGKKNKAEYYTNLAIIEINSNYNKYSSYAPTSYNELGNLLEHKKKFIEAKKYYNRAYKYYDSTRNLRYSVSVKENYTRVLFKENKIDSTIIVTKQILNNIRNKNWPRLEYSNYQILRDCYFLNNDSIKAYQYNDSCLQSMMNVNHLNNEEKLLEYETKYNTLKKELELSKVKKENSEIKNDNVYLLIISVLLSISILITIIYTKKISKNKKRITQLFEQEKKSNNEIEKLLKSKDYLLSETHHRIKNNLQLILSIIDFNEEHKEYNDNLKIKINSILELNKNLNFLEEKSEIDVHNLFQNINQNFKKLYPYISINFDLCINIKEQNINKINCIALIYTELVLNSIKHAKIIDNMLRVVFILKETKTQLEINYADNGQSEFEILELKEGHGLHLIDLLSKQLKGNVKIYYLKGFQFNLSLKK